MRDDHFGYRCLGESPTVEPGACFWMGNHAWDGLRRLKNLGPFTWGYTCVDNLAPP